MTQPTYFRAVAVQAAVAGTSLSLLSPETGDWIVLAGTARRIWERLEYPASVDEVATALGAEFDAPPETIKAAAAATIDDLLRLGLVAEEPAASRDASRDRYLSLLKRALGNMLYPELELMIDHLVEGAEGLFGAELERFQRDIAGRQPEAFTRLLAGKHQGTGPLRFAHTMIGLFRLSNIERCAERIFAEGIAGDFLEAGVCKGGATIFMRGLQVAHGESGRKTFVVDSFEGVPPSARICDSRYDLHFDEAMCPWLACSEKTVRDNFSRYDLLDPNVEFVKGWLAESLPRAQIGPLALLRIDVDLYSSTLECLELLYDRVVEGGFVIVDDYGFLQCCRDAVDEFRARRGVSEPILWADVSGIYWRKEAK
ncbi:MAG TPA: PqqD family peptide modification chaperone [Allosphingosinicella sp.]